MQKIVVGVVAGVLLIGGGLYIVQAEKQADAKMQAKQAMEEKALMEKAEMEKAEMLAKEEMALTEANLSEDKMMKDEATMMKKDEMGKAEMMEKEEQAMTDEATMKKSAGLYAPYEAAKLAMATSGDVVLFFKATWCPSCRALDSNIQANLEAIPADLTILTVDYDTATTLKAQYGVTTQHTLVQVDASGALIKKWSGGATLASVVEQVQ